MAYQLSFDRDICMAQAQAQAQAQRTLWLNSNLHVPLVYSYRSFLNIINVYRYIDGLRFEV